MHDALGPDNKRTTPWSHFTVMDKACISEVWDEIPIHFQTSTLQPE